MQSKHKELDMVGVRSLLCAIIEYAIVQARSKNKRIREEALSFLHSEVYERICDAMNLPASNLRNAAYDTKPNNSKKRQGGQTPKRHELQKVSGKLRPDIQEKGGIEL